MGYYYGDKNYVLDSAMIDDKGNFHYAGDSVLSGGLYFLFLSDKKLLLEFIIDKEQRFTIHTDTANLIKDIKVEGSPENEAFYKYQDYSATMYSKLQKLQDSAKKPAQKTAFKLRIDSLNTAMRKYKENFIKAHPDYFLSEVFKAAEDIDVPDAPILPNGRKDSTFAYRYYKAHFFDNITFSDDKLVHTPQPVFFTHIKEYFSRLTFPTPDSINAAADYILSKVHNSPDMFKFLVVYITNTYANSNIMGMDAVYVHMVKTYYTPKLATWVNASQLEKMRENADQLDPILIGKRAPSMVMPDTANIMTSLDSVKTRYTVVCFWDYDCGMCQQEMPKLIKWYDSAKVDGMIDVYAVETNINDIGKWKSYIKKHNLDWINVSNTFRTSNYSHEYDVVSTPIIYVLDEDKKIIAKKIDVKDLNGILKADMKMKSEKN